MPAGGPTSRERRESGPLALVGRRAVIRPDPRFSPGWQLVIEARGVSPEDVYIQSARGNGREETAPRIRFPDLVAGGTLVFEMGPTPNRALWSGSGR